MRLHGEEEESEGTKLLPHKHDIISVLGVGGHWVTSHKDLQVSHIVNDRMKYSVLIPHSHHSGVEV